VLDDKHSNPTTVCQTEYRLIVYKNVSESTQQVVIYMKMIGSECEEYSSRFPATTSSGPWAAFWHHHLIISCWESTRIQIGHVKNYPLISYWDCRSHSTTLEGSNRSENHGQTLKWVLFNQLSQLVRHHAVSQFKTYLQFKYIFDATLWMGDSGYTQNETDGLIVQSKQQILRKRVYNGQL